MDDARAKLYARWAVLSGDEGYTDEEYEQCKPLIIKWCDEAARRRNDWPGANEGNVPLAMQPAVERMIKEGLITRVKRPSEVNPGRMVSFLVRTS